MMKRSCAGLLLFALVGFVGCESKSTPGGPGVNKTTGNTSTSRTPGTTTTPGTTHTTPGTTNTTPGSTTNHGPATTDSTNSNRPLVGQGEETFTLSMPATSTKVAQGESKTVDISIKRGKNLDEDVTLKFSDLPKGVRIEPASPAIRHGDAGAKITVTAAEDAAVGDFTIPVTGHPTKGANAMGTLKITITKR